LTDGAARPAGRRYDVYRNNVAVSLIEAMKTAFPLVRKLIGAANFDTLAPLYVHAHPPKTPLMMFYGADFPAFLRQFEPLSHIGYLGDAAQLDLAMRTSYHAKDSVTFDATILETLPPEQLTTAVVTLAPATQIVRSPWPLFDIWRYNSDNTAPKPRAIAQDVIITRPEFDPAPHALPPGAADWLWALHEGHTIATAIDIAFNANPEFDLAATLGVALSTSAIHKITNKDLK
jgi:hypothetical protein